MDEPRAYLTDVNVVELGLSQRLIDLARVLADPGLSPVELKGFHTRAAHIMALAIRLHDDLARHAAARQRTEPSYMQILPPLPDTPVPRRRPGRPRTHRRPWMD